LVEGDAAGDKYTDFINTKKNTTTHDNISAHLNAFARANTKRQLVAMFVLPDMVASMYTVAIPVELPVTVKLGGPLPAGRNTKDPELSFVVVNENAKLLGPIAWPLGTPVDAGPDEITVVECCTS
jgi:hypothetical protein